MADDFKLKPESILIIFTAVLASLLEIVDTSIVNVAIPTMMGNLGATLEDISWVVTGYIIANAIVLPLSAWLGAQIGRRKYYVGCILLFTLASVACGLAPDLLTLTIFRVFQGLAGGALLPTSQAMIQEQFPREKAGTASAIYGMSVMIGPTIGPTLGGYLTDNYGWRMIFNINLPLGILAAALAFRYVKSAPKPVAPEPVLDPVTGLMKTVEFKKPKIDTIGLALLCVGIGCLQFVLERGQADEWFDSVPIRVCSLLAALAIPGFIWWELKVEAPIINIRLFKNAFVRSGTLLMTALGFMLYGLVFILPVFVGRVMNFSATQTGMLFIPGALLTAMCMPVVGALIRKRDPRVLILFGILTIECMLFMLTQFGAETGEPQVFRALLVRGLAMAFLFVPINAVVLGQFRGQELGQVSGLLNLSRQLGGSIGIALISTLLERNSHQNYVELASHVSLLNPQTRMAIAGTQQGMGSKLMSELGLTTMNNTALKAISYRIQQQVFLMSFTQMIWIVLIIFGFALVPLALMKKPAKVTGPVEAH
ncbi:MAG: DHA2 family efflux MFS transporter permease subunit [Methylotenera sp.]|nr:DHA2 family efflux MFS transporter permease subunit [Oligoflexia bacterium]